ncbi:MAG: hypothetical protein JO349_04555 [Candidatus Eremiobacteraeota bacterium]|nr:hypothetical protein [Candidatus Eremiobacteraeota bacterium]
MMLIAGCAGGRSIGSAPPSVNLGQPSSLTNGAAVALSITVPPRGSQANKRSTASQQGTRRTPSWVSPSTYYVALDEYFQGKSVYFNYFPLSQCTPSGSTYTCATNLPYGTVTLYTNLYDATGYLLSTNMYSNPAPITIYANGSAYSNNISVTTAAVVSNLQLQSPTDCFSAGFQQSIPLYFVDADGNIIVGPLANPLTSNFSAYNGAGFGAIALYATYNGSPLFLGPGATMYDTSVYSSPYLFVSGSEGAITIAGTFANIPVYNNNVLTYTPSAGYAATGVYVAWGLQSAPIYGLYTIAIEQSLNTAVVCGSANGTFQPFIYVGAFLDPASGHPYLAANDNNSVYFFDALVSTNYTHAYDYFEGQNPYGSAGPKSNLLQTAVFSPGVGSMIDFLTSVNTTGRVDVLSNVGGGQIDILDTSNGTVSVDNTLAQPIVQVPMTSSTRLAGSTVNGTLYWDNIGTTQALAASISPSDSFLGTVDVSAFGAINGQIYAMSPTGAGSNLVVVRGSDNTGPPPGFHVCAWDVVAGPAGMMCHNTGSGDINPFSIVFDPKSGDLMWAGGGNQAFAIPAHAVTPATFVANVTAAFAAPAYTFSNMTAFRIASAVAGDPGIIGFYGGPQAAGPCAGTGEFTFLQWNGASFQYLSTLCWPNHYVTVIYH